MEMVTVTGYLMTIWQDEYRIWNSTFPYNCTRKAIIPCSRIWIPDLSIRKSEQRLLPMDRNGDNVVVNSDGTSARTVAGTITFNCPLNMAMFPFDVQICVLTFDSWALDTSQQTYNIDETGTRLVNGYQNEEWDVIDLKMATGVTLFGKIDYARVRKKQLVNCYIPLFGFIFPEVDIEMVLKRKAGYYLLNIIAPSIIIALTEFATWAIPLHSDARLQLSFTCLLSFTMFQNMVAASMPKSSSNPPLLILYLTAMTILILLAILSQALVIHLHYTGTGPDFNKVFTKLGLFFGLKKTPTKNDGNGYSEFALKAFDKLIFILFLFLFFLNIFITFVVFPLL